MTEEDRRFWEELIKVDLRRFLQTNFSIARRAGGGELAGAEKLELVADLITFFFKAPLTFEPLLSLAPSPPSLYLALRLNKQFLKEFSRAPVDYLPTLIRMVDVESFIDEGLRAKITKAWLVFPADTRPGANTSSLVAHLLTTPAIAWSLAYNYNSTKDRRYLAIQRISSQLHDIAKPIEPRMHYRVEVFGELVNSLLSNILDKMEVDEVKEAVEQHHKDEKSPVRRADQISAAIDRIRDVIKVLIGNEFRTPEFMEMASRYQRDVFELAYGGGRDAWDFWATVEERMPGKIRELSEKFVERLGSVSEVRPSLRPYSDLSYFLVDIGGVQQFVYRSPKLSAVAAASLFIDYLTSAILPVFIQSWFEEEECVWVPLESFLLTSGANVAGILPGRIGADSLLRVVEELSRRLKPIEVDFKVAVAQFHEHYPHMWDEANKDMALAKISPRPGSSITDVSGGIEPSRICTLCYREEASIGELCATCSRLVEFGKNLGFRTKWMSGFILGQKKIVPRDVWGVEYGDEKDPDSIALNTIELISGMEPPFTGRELNVAVIKGDGNRMGEFFSKSISLSDAIERSFRLDHSLKTAYGKALQAILSADSADGKCERDACRIWLGTIYMGGDDFLILCPSWLSLPFSYILAKEFESGMGGKCTLSIGIAVVPPEHSVWHAIRAADELMEVAKVEIGRRGPASAISFDAVEQGLLSGETVLRRLEVQRSNGLTARPIPVESRSGFSLKHLLSFFGYSLDYHPADIMRHAYSHRPSKDGSGNPTISRLRLVRRAVRAAVECGTSMLGRWDEGNWESALKIATLYCYRESNDNSREEVLRRVFRDIGELCRRQLTDQAAESLRAAPLLDLDAAAKILGGGGI